MQLICFTLLFFFFSFLSSMTTFYYKERELICLGTEDFVFFFKWDFFRSARKQGVVYKCA